MTSGKHYITSSTKGESIVFATNEDFKAFKTEYLLLLKKYHKQNEAKYGFWASNQNKFVKSKEDLNSLDCQ